jgi:topoisomerase-4 subunit A
LKKLKFDADFAEMAIKGRGAKGNILTKHMVSKIKLKEEGTSTLSARKIWFDDTVQRLNSEGRGLLLGSFKSDDKILTITQSGHYKLAGTNLSTHFEDDLILIEKWIPEKPVTAIYFDAEKGDFYVKRFLVDDTDKKVLFITEDEKSYLELVSTDFNTVIELSFVKAKGKDQKPNEVLNLKEFISVKGMKAMGNKLSYNKIKAVDCLDHETAAEKMEVDVEELKENPFEQKTEAKPEQNNPESEAKESAEEVEGDEKQEGGAGKKQSDHKDDSTSDSEDNSQMDLFS